MTASARIEPQLDATRTSAAAATGGDAWRWVLLVLALGNLGNGAWMLAQPVGWFHDLPAAVPDFGPLNEHFVRDIGAAFLVQGLALAWAAFTPAWRVPLVAPVTAFYVLHALAHVYDTGRGLVGPAHWLIDLPAVYVPALLMVLILWLLARTPASRSSTQLH